VVTGSISVDVAVVGGGIVGLASARAVQRQQPGITVAVVEKEAALAGHQTGRNSGVVHAGIYYQPGSLKALLCTAGRVALKEYTASREIAYDECGKLIVALHEHELAGLQELYRRATENGVPGIRLVDATELREIEPSARGIAALHSPATAITDYPAVARAYGRDVEQAGGSVHLGFKVTAVEQVGRTQGDSGHATVRAADGRLIRAQHVLVCAGLYSDRIASSAGDLADPRIIPFRGDYFRLAADKAAAVRGLIYPVPDPELPFLGVHLTRTVRGEVLVGPNAVLAAAREGYTLRTVNLHDLADTLRWPGFWRFAKRYWRVGATEMRRATSRRMFAAEAAAYVPGITARDLVPAPAGVRAQALDSHGDMVEDFAITRVGRVVTVRNAPSPAATSSMPIGEELARRMFAEVPV
jgi:L-2-hydroxyglutarate oxidase